MIGDMGVRRRNAVDLASQQLQQTHRKCHHRQSYGKTDTEDIRSSINQPKLYNEEIKQQLQLLPHPPATPTSPPIIATSTTIQMQHYSVNHQRNPPSQSQSQSYPSKSNIPEQKRKQYTVFAAAPAIINPTSQSFPIQRGQELIVVTPPLVISGHEWRRQPRHVPHSHNKGENTRARVELKTRTEILNTPETDTLSWLTVNKLNNGLKRLSDFNAATANATTATAAFLSDGRNLLKCAFKCCSNYLWLIFLVTLLGLSASLRSHPKVLGGSSALAATFKLSARSVVMAATAAAASSTYEPIIKYDIVNRDDDGMTVEDIDVNSNEQQLLAYYKKAQKEHEEELKRQRQQKLQQQQQQLLLQRHHHQQERDIDREVLKPALQFDDIIPTSDVISSLNMLEDMGKLKKSTASKRSTTKRASSTSLPASTATTLTSTASAATTTISTSTTTTTMSPTKITTTATPEEKCEPKVLDEVPAEPVSLKLLLNFNQFHSKQTQI